MAGPRSGRRGCFYLARWLRRCLRLPRSVALARLARPRSGNRGDHALPGGDLRAAAGAGREGRVPRAVTGTLDRGPERRNRPKIGWNEPSDPLHSTTEPGAFCVAFQWKLRRFYWKRRSLPPQAIAESTASCRCFHFHWILGRFHCIRRSLPLDSATASIASDRRFHWKLPRMHWVPESILPCRTPVSGLLRPFAASC